MDDAVYAPLISVIIPTYNYAPYLGRAVNSALAQEEQCVIIIVDDGSTDNTREVIAAYNNDVTYVYQDNKGV
mgnify:CR=1 FL=1